MCCLWSVCIFHQKMHHYLFYRLCKSSILTDFLHRASFCGIERKQNLTSVWVKLFPVRTKHNGSNIIVHLQAEDLGQRLCRQNVNVAKLAVERDLEIWIIWFNWFELVSQIGSNNYSHLSNPGHGNIFNKLCLFTVCLAARHYCSLMEWGRKTNSSIFPQRNEG